MRKGMVAVATALMILALLSSSCQADKTAKQVKTGSFSFSFVVEGHSVIVTGLANGKSFAKIHGKPIAFQDGAFRGNAGKIAIVVMDAGQSVWIGDEELSISLMTKKPNMKDATAIKIGARKAYRSKGGVVTKEPPVWSFDFYFVSGKQSFDLLAISSTTTTPCLFEEVVKSLKVRKMR